MPSLNTGNAILSNAIAVNSSYNVGIGGAASGSYKLQVTGNVNADNFIIQPTGYGLLASLSRDLTGSGFGVLNLKNGSNGFIQPAALSVDRTYTLPDATGTIALTSNLSAYLPLTGGTLTGALSGTSATFNGAVVIGNDNAYALTIGRYSAGIPITYIKASTSSTGGFRLTNYNGADVIIVNGSNAITLDGPFLEIGGSGVSAPPAGLSYGLFPQSSIGLGLCSLYGMTFWTGTTPAERMRISSLGALTYNTTDTQGWFAGFSVNGTNFAYLGSTGQFANSGGTATDFGIRSANALAFYTSGGAERMRITSGGNFDYGGFNIQSSNNPTYRQAFYGGLSIMWRGFTDSYINSNHTYSSSNTNVASYTTSNGIGRLDLVGGNLGWSSYNGDVDAGTAYSLTSIFKISSAGIITSLPTYNNTTGVAANLQIDSNGFLARSTSSLKYKTDISNYDKGLNIVNQLRPVYYKGINDGDKVFAGLIAEDVHELGLTEFVQYAEDGSPDALSYSNMVSLLVKAIQELNQKINEQQQTINSLINR